MDDFTITVEELEFSLREGNEDKRRLQMETSGTKSTTLVTSTDSKPLNETPLENHPSKKHSALPSICQTKVEKSDSSLTYTDKSQDEASRGFQPVNDRLSLENLSIDHRQATHHGQSTSSLKSGKKFLAPLGDRKHHSAIPRERSTTNPELSTLKLRHKTQSETLRKHQSIEAGTEAEAASTTRAQFPNGSHTKSKENFYTPERNEEKITLLDIPTQTRRRFSAPLSPRFVRRLIPEKFYSSSDTERGNDYHQDPQTEVRARTPDRGSIFSPPSKEFDAIQDDNEQRKDFVQTSVPRAPRKSLDLDFRANPTRFLSEIKVSLADKNDQYLRKGRVKSTEKRQNSYTALSASSEALRDILPPVKTSMPECAPPRRNRALSHSGLMPLGRNDMVKRPFDSPMFLDIETQRLNHLSLSPRLPRKF